MNVQSNYGTTSLYKEPIWEEPIWDTHPYQHMLLTVGLLSDSLVRTATDVFATYFQNHILKSPIIAPASITFYTPKWHEFFNRHLSFIGYFACPVLLLIHLANQKDPDHLDCLPYPYPSHPLDRIQSE